MENWIILLHVVPYIPCKILGFVKEKKRNENAADNILFYVLKIMLSTKEIHGQDKLIFCWADSWLIWQIEKIVSVSELYILPGYLLSCHWTQAGISSDLVAILSCLCWPIRGKRQPSCHWQISWLSQITNQIIPFL